MTDNLPARRDATDMRLPLERIMARVVINDAGCWVFTGSLTTKGYGQIRVGGRRVVAVHRFTYEHHVGPIPEGMVLDHLCRNRACCNPAHLEPVTSRENYLRGDRRSRTTHCPAGHPYDEANTYVHVNSAGQRRRACRTCRNQQPDAPREWREDYERDRHQLVRQAADVLGCTPTEVKREYGRSKDALRKLIAGGRP